jgi:hypothetical protein
LVERFQGALIKRYGVVELDLILLFDDAKDRSAMQDCPAFLYLLLDPPKARKQENYWSQPNAPDSAIIKFSKCMCIFLLQHNP